MRTIGHVSDAVLDEVMAAGFSDAAITEMTINVFTNAVNHIAVTIPDYPAVCAR
jgi:hypothetical protein